MYEELFIIDKGKRLRVDLSIPSGITLNFKSNIFGDLSKITCSYSYTFKLPMTVNNRRVLDNADDIRSQSIMVRRRLKCEYVQNGIPLFSNANLYIDSTDTCFNAVMTWGVIGGFQTLKDDDVSLQELPNDNTETTLGPFELGGSSGESSTPSRGDSGISDTGETIHAFDNLALTLGPDYNCGIPHRNWKRSVSSGYRSAGWSTYYGSRPLPVVPVYKIISLINQKYGTNFKLGKHLTSDNISELDQQQEVIEVGVVPLVSTKLNSVQLEKRTATLSGMRFEKVNLTLSETAGENKTEATFPDIITFGTITTANRYDDYFRAGSFMFSNSGHSGDTKSNVGIMPQISNMSLELDGHLRVCFEGLGTGRGGSNDTPELKIYQRRRANYRPNMPGYNRTNRAYYEWGELGSLSGEQDGKNGDYYIYDFNFSAAEMFERIECRDLAASSCSPILFAFSHNIKGIVYQTPIKVILINSTDCVHKMDVISNLPDISCLTFMKSLFYMIGAFPSTDPAGNIIPVFYSTLKDNLGKGNVVDWSKKYNGTIDALPKKTAYVCGEFAQRNFYLMKSDADISKEETSKEDDNKDVFYSGAGELVVDNQVITATKTIIQLPFYAPYNYDKTLPNYDMGQTFKCWTLEKEDGKRKLVWVDPKPCIGLIRDREYYTSTDGGPYVVSGTVMSMIVWNGFTQMVENQSYNYLQKIMLKPFVITEELALNEIDLRDIDYSIPVYLSKYGAFFAIVSITRDSKGICKCELLKLPEEE